MQSTWTWVTRGTLIGVVVVALGACQSGPPRGSTGGRIDPYRTTPSDRASAKASIPALLEFTDKTAEKLARDITDKPFVKNAKTRLVLELGSISNKTNTPTTDFELIQKRLRSKLLNSTLLTDNFKIVADPQRMDRERQRLQGGGSQDLLQEKTQPTKRTNRYPADKTYVLQGDFLQARRGQRSQFYFEFKLVNLKSREITFSSSYDLGQVSS